LAIPATYTFESSIGRNRLKEAQDWGRAAIILLMIVVPWTLTFPRLSNLEHLRQAGYWIKNNLSSGTKVLVNDGRIAYFSTREYEKEILIRPTIDSIKADLHLADYAVLEFAKSATTNTVPVGPDTKIITKIEGKDGSFVLVYRLH